jgi:hypothetical protein
MAIDPLLEFGAGAAPAAAERLPGAELTAYTVTGASYGMPVPQPTPSESLEPGSCPGFYGGVVDEVTIATIGTSRVVGASMAELPICFACVSVQPSEPFRTYRRLHSLLKAYSPQPTAGVLVLPLYTPPKPSPPPALLKHSESETESQILGSAPEAFQAFKDVAEWLRASDEEVAEAIGIGRTTVYAWRREGREPRRGTARRLYELHSVLAALRRRMGSERYELWLNQGTPSWRQAVLLGDFSVLEPVIESELFAQPGRQKFDWTPEDRGSLEPAVSSTRPRVSGRKAKRVRSR